MDGKKLEYKGEEALREIERVTKNADEVQKKILKDILKQNGETEYLKKYIIIKKSSSSKDDIVEEFKRCVPVVTFRSILPFVQRIANGQDSSLISGHQITEMLCSSGTSNGKPKMMPSIAEDLDRRTFLYNLIMPIMNQYIPDLDQGKAMFLYFVKQETSTPCGLPARTVLTSYYKSKHFKCRPRDDPFNDFTSPDQAILCNDTNQSMYCQLLAALLHRSHVLRLGAVFASAFLRAVSFLERNWLLLCNDIRSGQLNPIITDPGCRSAMAALLSSPNPCLADQIDGICRRQSWKGILCRLWPRAKYIEAVVTGSMAQYVAALEYYSGGKLPLVCSMYASSECYFGVNLKPLSKPAEVSFTLLPNMCYFEFLPLGENGTLSIDAYSQDDDEVSPSKLVDLVDVKIGCFYELVVTTFSGLNRYRIGDVVQARGFHNRAPHFRFICRRNVLLSIDNDKTNEQDLHKSIAIAKKLLEPFNALLVEYTSFADTSSTPGHYVLYWEIRLHSPNPNSSAALDFSIVLQDCCIAVEEHLDYVYRRCRANDKSIGPLEIRLVRAGTFDSLMDLIIAQGGSINQYKTPRCVNSNSDAIRLLDANLECSFFSPMDPAWVP